VQRRILVVKLSSLGDFVQSLGCFRAIREHHRGDRLTLLTTAPYRPLALASGLFDQVTIDRRVSPWRPLSCLRFAWDLNTAGWSRIYDLQWSERSAWYFRLLLPPRPEWVGVAPGCSHFYPERRAPRHISVRHAEMLRAAGIAEVPQPDLSFLTADLSGFGLSGGYGLVIPGSSPHRRVKRWPVAGFIAVARSLAAQGLTPVVVRGPAERVEAEAILEACPQARAFDTSLEQLVALARGARVAVGNDTGPTFLAALAGAPVIALFSIESDPAKSTPPGPCVRVLRQASLAELSVERVLEAVGQLLDQPCRAASSSS